MQYEVTLVLVGLEKGEPLKSPCSFCDIISRIQGASSKARPQLKGDTMTKDFIVSVRFAGVDDQTTKVSVMTVEADSEMEARGLASMAAAHGMVERGGKTYHFPVHNREKERPAGMKIVQVIQVAE